VCGSRTEAVQKNKNIFNSLAAIICKNKYMVAGNSKKVVRLCLIHPVMVSNSKDKAAEKTVTHPNCQWRRTT